MQGGLRVVCSSLCSIWRTERSPHLSHDGASDYPGSVRRGRRYLAKDAAHRFPIDLVRLEINTYLVLDTAEIKIGKSNQVGCRKVMS